MLLLRRALDIELGFEQDAQWEGYYEREKLRSLLMELIIDSSQHAEMVQSLIKMVKVTPGKTFPPVHDRTFDFRNKDELEMMEIGRTEILMRDIYTDIRNGFTASTQSLLVEQADTEKFLAAIESLILAETNHSELAASTQARPRGSIEAPESALRS